MYELRDSASEHSYVSILMLTHNAPAYVQEAVQSIRDLTSDVLYELVAVDNASELETKHLVTDLRAQGFIDKLLLSDSNLLFAAGNNRAAKMASEQATHFLLLNSDVKLKSSSWLSHISSRYTHAAAPRMASLPIPFAWMAIVFLSTSDLYKRNLLREDFPWAWSVTYLQAQILSDGYACTGISEHEDWLHHYGGKSGDAWRGSAGMDLTRNEATAWFEGREPLILDKDWLGRIPGHPEYKDHPLARFVKATRYIARPLIRSVRGRKLRPRRTQH